MSTILESIGLADTPENNLNVESALEWLTRSTTLDIDKENLSPSVKLFVLKYSQLMTNHTGIASESISGLSQSFETGRSLESQLYDLASSIFGNDCLKSTVTVLSGEDKWDYGCNC